VTHLATALFFLAVLIGAAVVIHLTVREHWQEMLAALNGEAPVHHTARPWTYRVKVEPRPRPFAARAEAWRHAAA
jgi:hypothetical protein